MSQTPGVSRRGRGRRSWRPWAVAGVVVLALLGVAAWLGMSWLSTYREAQAASSSLTSLRSAITAKDWSGAVDALPAASADADALSSSTADVQWRLLASLPVIGSSADAVREVAVATSDVLAAATPLSPYAARIAGGELRSADGAIDLGAMQEVAPLLVTLSSAMSSSSARLERVDAASVRPEVGEPLVELRDALLDATPLVQTAASVTEWVPGLLGAEGERSWLVLLQNPSEARGAGGFPGGYLVLTTDAGRVGVSSSGTSSDLNTTAIPSDSAPEDARVLWGDILKRWNAFNVSPHFPMTGALAAAGMEARNEPVSGVVAIDPSAVAGLLAITGPVTASGVTITADTVEEFFTVGVYEQFPDSVERDAVSMDLVSAVLSTFLATTWDPTALVEALRDPVASGRVLAWSADADEQEYLESLPVGGSLPDMPGPVLGVAFNNVGENKTDAFVATSVDYAPGTCPTTTTQLSSLDVTLRNDAPDDLPTESGVYGRVDKPDAVPGSTRMLVHVYAPVGAGYLSSTLDGEDVPLYLGEERNRPVWWNYVELEPGDERTLSVEFTEPTVLGVEPRVLPQAMVIDEVITVRPTPGC